MMKTFLLSASATLLMAGTAIAQTSHGIAAVVNDDIVTTHDLRQRTLFMVATKQTISDQEINQNVAQLIGRNGLDPNEVVQRLASAGVSIETLRDQVRSEIAWQRIINGLYGSRIRISDAQIDETLNRLTANASKPNYRVAEIYIEATEDIGGMEGAMQGAEAMVKPLPASGAAIFILPNGG